MSRCAGCEAAQRRRTVRLAVPLALALALLAACAAGGVGVGVEDEYWGDPSFDYDMDFDAPFGFDEPWGYGYGGWGPGYFVGPPAWGHRGGPGPGAPPPHRIEPPSRPLPSIPTGRRGSGMRGMPR
ncbi:MAG TPA: hypothetical protein VEG26_05605 [Steroidobacteraceae bacterium]|nr:hypothetical protein [Steroidobacteraceae bacterium]